MKNIFAYTETNYKPETYPAYISINRDYNGSFWIGVRERSDDTSRSARISVSPETLEHLAAYIMAFFGEEEESGSKEASDAAQEPGHEAILREFNRPNWVRMKFADGGDGIALDAVTAIDFVRACTASAQPAIDVLEQAAQEPECGCGDDKYPWGCPKHGAAQAAQPVAQPCRDDVLLSLPDPAYIYHDSQEAGADELFEFAVSGAVDEDCSYCKRLYTTDQMRDYALAALRTQPAQQTEPSVPAPEAGKAGAGDRADQSGFEAWAKRHGGLPLDLANGVQGRRWIFCTYRDTCTEIAWRAWANRPTAPDACKEDLLPHLRQFMHNDGSGFVVGYDKLGVDRLVAHLQAKATPTFETVDDLISWLDSLHQMEGAAITNRKWDDAQKAISALRSAAPAASVPAQAVTLTDEDVADIACHLGMYDIQDGGRMDRSTILDFARDIERRLLSGSAKTGEAG